MAKFVAIAALCLAAILAVAIGQGEAEQRELRDMRCQREVQENPLDACRQVLHRQLTGRTGYGHGPFEWSTGMRMQCCQQLQDVSRECCECRCAAIRRMVRGYEQTMPPLESGSGYGEGRPCSQQGSGYSGCGETGWRRRQQGGEYYGGEAGQQGGQGCGCGCSQRGGGQQPATRVRLGKVRQYAAQLPMMCRIEPQEYNVFSGAGTDY